MKLSSLSARGKEEARGREQGSILAPTRRPAPLAVTLPSIPTVPRTWRGARYVIRKLLGAGDTNPKLLKSNRAGTPYQTWGLALAPARESGHQLCASSSPGCRASCLYRQGMSRLDETIAVCRIAKAVAWKEHTDWFKEMLTYELAAIARKADRDGFKVAVRLNLVSDVMWEHTWGDLFEMFEEFQFYDYSKHFRRMLRFIQGDFPLNYHLTFSKSEDNDLACREVLAAGGNVAVVFRGRELPTRFWGYPVVDGDVTDLRFMDPAGVVVGLRAKGTARNDDSGFVVDVGERIPLLTL